MKHTCPVCKKAVEVSTQGQLGDSGFSPFCSQRCKLIDLGAWLDGEYAIAVTPDSEQLEEPSDINIHPSDKP